MANLVGKWKIAHSENFEEFLTALGATPERVAMAKHVESTATTEFYFDGNVAGRRIYKADGTLFVDKKAVVGVEQDDLSMVGDQPVKILVNVIGDSKSTREEHGDNYHAKTSLEYVNGEIHQILEGGGVTSTRTFVRA